MQTIQTYIIAGGASRRMGKDKRFLELDGESLLDRIIRISIEAVGTAPILVGDNYKVKMDPSLRWDDKQVIIPDFIPGKGPLGGLVSAMEHAESEWIMILAVDLPFLEVEHLEKLLTATRDDLDVITLSDGDSVEPLVGLYSTKQKPFWKERLLNDQLGLQKGIRNLRFSRVTLSDPGGLSNWNNPEDISSR